MPKKMMRLITFFCFAAAVIAAILYRCPGGDIFLTLAITFGTTAYHFGMRLLVGLLYHIVMNNRADYTKKWYQIRPWEQTAYRFLKVKKWKDKMPTYHPEMFFIKHHSWDEIAQTMCQAELVHETNMVFSFLPLIAVKWFGSFSVFLITSVCSAAFDLMFVIVQRYNRTRVVKLAMKERRCKMN